MADHDLRKLIKDELPSLRDLRQELHRHPQLGYEETYASEAVQRELTAASVPHQAGLAETGVVGWLPEANTGSMPAVGLRADMDALPIQEDTGLDYASEHDGLMHACGHDGHTTMLIGAARVLARCQRDLPQPVKFVFQPAEEEGAGAARMIEDGALDNSTGGIVMGRMFGLHNWPLLELGHVGMRDGVFMAAAKRLAITLDGAGGHAASPHQTADPVIAASHLITALQTVVSRNLKPTDAAVVSVTSMSAGLAFNVIPDSVTLIGTVRTLKDATSELVERRIHELAHHVAAGFGCHATVSISEGYPVTINDPAAAEQLRQTAGETIGPDRVVDLLDPSMGAEDFAFYGRKVPAAFCFLGIRPPDAESWPNLHSPHYEFNDDVIATGVELLCRLALQPNP